jgi:RimJ/RimL family protein N-acetyltransferase
MHSLSTVRAARIEDADAIAEVHIQARNAYYRGFVPEEDLDRRAAELREAYRSLSRRTDLTLLCAEQDDVIVGIALLGSPYDTELDPAEVGELYQLHVRPGHWRQGIGSQLHSACLHAWQELGLSIGVLEMWERNDRARAFYSSHGWQPDGYSRSYGDTNYVRLRRTLTHQMDI